jgi:hypothetical protein
MSGVQRKETQKQMKTNHKLAALVACVAAACLVAACGSATSSSSSPSGGASGAAASTGTRTAARSKFVTCLKQHGVTLPARRGGFRPSGSASNGNGTPPAGGFGGGGFGGRGFGGGGFGGGGFGARFRSNPKLRAAFKACAPNFPARRFNPAQRKTEIDNFVKCVRQHGYNLPTPNLSGNGPVFPRTIESKKKFEAAARSCASVLAPHGGPPPGGQSTTAASTA